MKFKRIMAFLIAVCMTLSMAVAVSASETTAGSDETSYVTNARNGIIQVNLVYTPQGSSTKVVLQGGTGFLVGTGSGATTLLTNRHVVVIADEDKELYKEILGVDFNQQENLNCLSIEAVVKADMTMKCDVVTLSESYDMAVLKTASAMGGNRSGLVLGNSDSDVLKDMESVHAMGFPGVISLINNLDQTYTQDNVIITNGKVSGRNSYQISDVAVGVIVHEAKLTEGNSGGPLVNDNGIVVGVNFGGAEGYNYAIAVNEIRDILDGFNIAYEYSPDNKAVDGGSAEASEQPTEATEEPEPTEAPVSFDQLQSAVDEAEKKLSSDKTYTDESKAALESAVEDAKVVLDSAAATQAEADSQAEAVQEAINGLQEKAGMNMTMIIIIAVAVLVVIIAIILAIVLSGKKKKTTPTGAGGGFTSVPPVGPASGTGSNATTVLNNGSSATTVLGGGGAGGAANATLLRVKNNQRISISKQLFKIGRDRNYVDYCVSDNSSVGRQHADIIFKGGSYYILDHNSTNFTFINGKQIPANKEIRLNNNDRIKLANEEFVFKAF